MKHEDSNIEEILKRHLPSASQEEAAADCDHVLQHLRARASQAKSSRPLKRKVRWLAFAAVAAAIILAVFIPVMFRETPGVLEVAARKVHFGEVVRSSIFGEVVVLSDGSRVEMRTDSELMLERADDGVRVRLTKGGVIVNAAKQGSGHLYVQTKDVLVSVVGTIFLVNTEAEGSRVAVYEGEVRVQEGGKEHKLRSGEQVATSPRMELLGMQEAISWSRQAEVTAALLPQPVPAAIQAPTSPRVAFEEVSIRTGGTFVPGQRGGLANVNIRGTGCSAGSAPEIDPRRFAVFTKSVFSVITMAYFGGGFQTCQYVTPLEMLTGAPEWIKSDAFSIQATIPEGSFSTTPTLHDPKLKKMLQTILEERFKLTLRHETKEMPAYVMTLKDPSKFVASKDGLIWVTKKPDFWNEGMEQRQGTVAAEGPWVYGLNATMTELVPLLGRLTGRPIVDRTGFTGRFIFSVVYDMEFTRPLDPRDGIGPGDIKFPGDPRPPNEIRSLLSILEKEAGIRLESSKEPVEVLVIDHVERPTEN